MPNDTVISALEALLADSHALGLKTQNYHWNVRGPQFNGLHTLFETQYNEIALAVDEAAERIRALGARAPGGYAAFAGLTSIADGDGAKDARGMLIDLADSHKTAAKTANRVLKAAQDAEDEVTADLAIGRITAHDKAAWMLSAHLD